MINPMMYRVFLKEEDAGFTVSTIGIFAWTHTDPNYRPSLKEQLARVEHQNSLGVRVNEALNQSLEKHWVVDGPYVYHDFDRAMDQAHDLALAGAKDLTEQLSGSTGVPYVLIDVSSRGDRKEAEKLSKVIYGLHVPDASPRAADIGD